AAREQLQIRVNALEAETHRLQVAAISDSGERIARQAAEAERDRMEQRLATLQEEAEADRARFRERLLAAQAEVEQAKSAPKEDPAQVAELTAQVNKLRLDAARVEDLESARKAALAERDQMKDKLADLEL